MVITTKKGTQRKGLGVSASFGTTLGTIDPSTFVRYQKEYGPGYSAYQGWYASEYAPLNPNDPAGMEYDDFGNGPALMTATYEDASYGVKLDPNILAYDWRSLYPEISDWYGKQFPLVAGANDASAFYETSRMFNTNVAVDGGTEKANYRLSFTNVDQKGVLPNSHIARNTVSFAGGYNVTDRIKVSSTANYVLTEGLGRYGTGYDNRNVNQSFRQWYQVTTDMEDQRRAYEETGLNLSWNPYGALDPDRGTVPHYFDNYYFNRFENFNTDERNRFFGNVQVDYKLTDWLSFLGRVSTDRYSELREERIAVGSVDVSSYYRQNRNFYENNIDLILNAEKYFGDNEMFNVSGMIGANYRRTGIDAVSAQTNGGLVTPGVYSLSNSANNPQAPGESSTTVGVNGYFARANFGLAKTLYLDLTGRYDIASTLPKENSQFFYPSASLSFVFSELMNNAGMFNFGKLRLNYAEVGNLADPLLVNDIYVLNTPFNGVPLSTASSIRRNPNLVSENTKSYEVGLELAFFQNRLSLDVTAYQANSFNQIYRASVTAATGRLTDVVNAGEIKNQGIELTMRASVIDTRDFKWRVNINWARNVSEVVDLFGDQTNLQLNSVQGGITLNATEGEPFGAIWGTDFVYHTDGSPIVYSHPFGGVRYRKTGTPGVIGNINPDWKGGIQNIVSFKGVSLSFLIDIQKGGDFFSLDTWYGYATGIYDITAGVNENGIPVRDLPAKFGVDPANSGGGVYRPGAVVQSRDANGAWQFDADGKPVSDGTANDYAFYVSDVYNSLGYVYAPGALHVYDASFVKLREVNLNYSLPRAIVDKTPFQGVDVSLIGRNLWILFKNSPYSDPEDGLSAGNNLGNQSGAYPAVREYGFNVGLRF
ncbi:MAG: SusC/RagA family TonB-linked outer membrane protein [Bacteroidia bacterium]